MIYSLAYFFREVSVNMRRNIIMTMASISTTMILSIILGFFIVIIMNMNYWSENVVSQLQIVAYLSEDVTEKQIRVLKSSLETTPHVVNVIFISKEMALNRLRVKMKNQLEISDIGKNPLPDSFEIKVDEPDKIPQVATILKNMPGIEKVRYGERIANKLITVNRAIHWVGFIIIAALLISTIFIVSNTIRLTVFARRKEIEVMQLVGAANWFIRWPFILEGILQGFLGSLISLIILEGVYAYFIPKFKAAMPFFIMVSPEIAFNTVNISLLGTGIFVGAVGSLISVNKFLRL